MGKEFESFETEKGIRTGDVREKLKAETFEKLGGTIASKLPEITGNIVAAGAKLHTIDLGSKEMDNLIQEIQEWVYALFFIQQSYRAYKES